MSTAFSDRAVIAGYPPEVAAQCGTVRLLRPDGIGWPWRAAATGALRAPGPASDGARHQRKLGRQATARAVDQFSLERMVGSTVDPDCRQ